MSQIFRWCLVVVSLFWVSTSQAQSTSSPSQTTTPPPAWHWNMTGATLQILSIAEGPKQQVLGQLTLPTIPAQVLRWGPYLYVAGRSAGLLVIDVSTPQKPTLVAQKAQGSDVIGLRLEGTLLVLEIARYQFQVLSLQQPANPLGLAPQGVTTPEQMAGRTAQPPSTATPHAVRPDVSDPTKTSSTGTTKPPQTETSPVVRKIEGKVIRVSRGWVVINKGSRDGLALDSRIAIRSHKQVRVYDPGQDREKVAISREITAVITITKIYPDSASGQLGRGDRAYSNDFFEQTDKPLTSRLFFPTRPAQHWRLRFGLTPVIGVDASAVGFLSFSSLSYSFEFPFKIEVAMSPLTFVLGSPLSNASNNVIAVFSYNTNYIELMLGAGYQAMIDGTSGFLLMQGIRLGAIDGLNFVFINQLVLAPQYLGLPSSQLKFQIGAIHGEMNIPLTPRITLYLSGGGGSVTWFHGLIGIRTYIWGQGGGNTFVFSGGLGGGGVIPNTATNKAAGAVGPLISAEIDWRF